jgi:uncharacterized membrane protein
MKRYITAYLVVGLVFLAVDAVWLSLMADRLYRPLLGPLLAPEFKLMPAVLFYLIYVAGTVFFAVVPAFATNRVGTAELRGALFGFCAYSTYDLTNHATLAGWPAIVSVADIVWGSTLTALSATVGFLVARRVAPARP